MKDYEACIKIYQWASREELLKNFNQPRGEENRRRIMWLGETVTRRLGDEITWKGDKICFGDNVDGKIWQKSLAISWLGEKSIKHHPPLLSKSR
jgi:hypothetical protein